MSKTGNNNGYSPKPPTSFNLAVHRTIINSPLYQAINEWKQGLKDYPDRKAAQEIISGIRCGFRIRATSELLPTLDTQLNNLPSARDDPAVITRRIDEELAQGRLLEINDEWAPFVHTSPLGSVPKRPTGSRLIHHLSAPWGSSVNDTISAADAHVTYGSVDNAAKHLVQIGKGAFMFKIDFKDAFRHVHVHPHDAVLLGMRWQGKTYVDLCLPFGLRSSPAIFVQLATAAVWIAKRAVRTYDPGLADSLHIECFLDDHLGITLDETDGNVAMATILDAFTELGLTVNLPKCHDPAQVVPFLGIELDALKQEARLPRDKQNEMLATVNNFLTRAQASKRDLLSLAGTLFHATKVVPPGRAFVGSILRAAHGLKNLHDVADITSTYEDLRWWFIFLNHWNGKVLLTFGPATAHFELGIQLSAVRSDASSKLGYGILYDNEWCAGSWPHSLDPEAIHVKEATPLVIAASIWGRQWSSLHINFETDNAAVAHAVNNGLPHNRQLRSLVRLLWLQALKYNFRFSSTYVPGVSNVDADDLSRGRINDFLTRSHKSGRSVRCVFPEPTQLRLIESALTT